MITKKCAVSFITFALSLLIMFAGVLFMSLFTVSKWVGVGVGGGVLCLLLILYFVFRKKYRQLRYGVIPVASFATGVTVSSVFVLNRASVITSGLALQTAYPPVWQTAVLFGALLAAFYLYCLCTNLSFCRRHYKISLWVYAIALLATAVLLFVFLKSPIYLLAVFGLIPTIAFLISLSIDAYNTDEHMQTLVYCAFGILIVAIIVVLLILSEGDVDGLDGSGTTAAASKRHNPYAYLNQGIEG